MHSRSGRISAISDAGDGKHTRISITHGKQKRDKMSGDLTGFHRHESTVHVPTAHAKGYAVGQRVHSGISPAEEQNEVGNDNEMNEQDQVASEAIATPGRQMPKGQIPQRKITKARTKIRGAMAKGRK